MKMAGPILIYKLYVVDTHESILKKNIKKMFENNCSHKIFLNIYIFFKGYVLM